jgi:DNA-binding PadR family transcriptional regulator
VTLTTTRCALLGLLAERPKSGYELAASVEETIANFWPVVRSQVYRELAVLESQGLVTGERVTQNGVPDKRVMRITDAGREALAAWLEDPAFEPSRARNGLLVKLFFGAQMDPAQVAELLAAYRADAAARLERYEGYAEDLRDDEDSVFKLATVLHGIHRLRAVLAWVDEVAPKLAAAAVR